jgi:hypothetical protein
VAATALVLGSIGWNLTHLPPAVHPDGGFPRAQTAADRVDQQLSAAGVDRGQRVEVGSRPGFKSSEAMLYPLRRIGRSYTATLPSGSLAPGSSGMSEPAVGLIVLCDELFRETIGADCGGPAEDTVAGEFGFPVVRMRVDGFEIAPGRWIFVYVLPRPQ